MNHWKVVLSPHVEKWLERNKSNTSTINRFKQFIADIRLLSDTSSPARLSHEKIGYVKIGNEKLPKYSYKLGNSYRLSFCVDNLNHKVVIMKLGDHKEVYGRG